MGQLLPCDNIAQAGCLSKNEATRAIEWQLECKWKGSFALLGHPEPMLIVGPIDSIRGRNVGALEAES